MYQLRGTIWKSYFRIECVECGARSTQYGGIFPVPGNQPCAEFVAEVNAVKDTVCAKIAQMYGLPSD